MAGSSSNSVAAARPRRSFLDRPIARLLALVVVLVCTGALVWLHRADLLPETFAPEPGPFARCVAEQWAQIDNMAAEGVVDAERAELFKSRAEAMCRAEHPEP